jgi:hypothetical protein
MFEGGSCEDKSTDFYQWVGDICNLFKDFYRRSLDNEYHVLRVIPRADTSEITEDFNPTGYHCGGRTLAFTAYQYEWAAWSDPALHFSEYKRGDNSTP